MSIALFLMPALLFMTVFLFYPFIMSFVKSFYKTDGFIESIFVGVDNYKRLIQDSTIHIALINTFKLMFYVCVFQVGFGVVLAILVDGIKRGSKFFRTVYFFPIVISATAIGMMFKLFYTYDGGLFNSIILMLNKWIPWLHLESTIWITTKSALRMIALPTVWQYIGFYFVIILTAIKQIPRYLYESAYLDGINGFSKTIYITLPLIKNQIITCFILAITGTLKVFDMALVITEGGPLNQSQILGLYMYQKAFIDNRFGYGAAISVLIVVLGLSISLLVNKVFKKEDITY